MRIAVNGIKLFVDVSGLSLIEGDGEMVLRPTLVSVHGGPGLDHVGMRDNLAPLGDEMQVLYYDQRGHGRSDYGVADEWNLQTWATDLRDLCDALGLFKPIVLGSSFGGFVVNKYAAMFPDHPGGVILSNTTGGRMDNDLSVQRFGEVGGPAAAAAARRDFDEMTQESSDLFDEFCFPLFSSKPGFKELLEKRLKLAIRTMDVNLHFFRGAATAPDPWTDIPQIRCPVLVLGGTVDPICPIELVEEYAAELAKYTTTDFVRLEGASHAVFRDAPKQALAAVSDFVRKNWRPDADGVKQPAEAAETAAV